MLIIPLLASNYPEDLVHSGTVFQFHRICGENAEIGMKIHMLYLNRWGACENSEEFYSLCL